MFLFGFVVGIMVGLVFGAGVWLFLLAYGWGSDE